MFWRRWGPVIAWATLIGVFSTSSFSALGSSRILLPLLRWMLPWASTETLWFLHFCIRKSAHFVEYVVFSLLLLRGIRGPRNGWRLSWGLAAVAIAAACAGLDELHQSFVPDRTASPWDSLLDTLGATIAQLLAWVRAHRRASGRTQEEVTSLR